MKEKKGKKSLEDLDNSLKRSTRLKELSRLVPIQKFGANGVSISTTSSSDKPPSYLIVKDGVEMCNIVGYYVKDYNYNVDGYTSEYDKSKLLHIGGGVGNGGGWFYFDNGFSSFQNQPKYNFNGQSGFLFLYLNSPASHEFICNKCYDGRNDLEKLFNPSFDPYKKVCTSTDTNQDPIFAVLINSISQINAFNRTMASSGIQTISQLSSGIFLSTTINSSNDLKIKNVIKQIRESTGETEMTTPIISPVNPITVITNDYIDIDLSNVSEIQTNGGLSAYKDFDISKLIKRENFVNNMGSIEFTEFMSFSYTSGYSATFLLLGGGESTILGSLDQLDKSNGGLGFIRVRRSISGFGSLFGGYEGNRIGSFEIGFTQPYYEIQNTFYIPKRLSIKFRVIFK